MMQFRFDGTSRLTHPENHGRQHENGYEPDNGLEKLLRPLREFCAYKLEDCANCQRHRQGQQHTNPNNRHPGAASGLVQIARDNAND